MPIHGRGFPSRVIAGRLPAAQKSATISPSTIHIVTSFPTPTWVAESPDAIMRPATIHITTTFPIPAWMAQHHATIAPSTIHIVTRMHDAFFPPTPGGLLSADTRRGQMEWRSRRFGAYGDKYQLETIDGTGDMPGVDNGTTLNPADHGGSEGELLAQTRLIVATVVLDSTPDSFDADLEELEQLTPIERDPDPTDDRNILVVRPPNRRAGLFYGRVIGRSEPFELAGQGVMALNIRWECADSRRYGIDPRQADIPVGGSVLATNAGNTETKPKIFIPGPVTNPTLTNSKTGRVLSFAIILAPGETMTVDARLGTVFVDDVDAEDSLADLSVWVEQFELDPGTQQILYTATSGGSGGVDLLWRDASH